MRLSINSGKEEMDYEEAFRKWSSLKARRIFHVNFNQTSDDICEQVKCDVKCVCAVLV